MKTNFDFLKDIDDDLFETVLDAQKLFQDEYFNQSCVQLRIFAEKIAKNLIPQTSQNQTFDDILNCLKDKIKDEREKEFVEDLFFIKKLGNKSAHGEDIKPSDALKAFERAFEAAISYVYFIKKDENINKLEFDCTLLIAREKKDAKLVDKYLKLAKKSQEELLNLKQGEFMQKVDKNTNGIENHSFVNDINQYKDNNDGAKNDTKNDYNAADGAKKTKLKNPKKEKIKEKIKLAKNNLKTINKSDKTRFKKVQKQPDNFKKAKNQIKKKNKAKKKIKKQSGNSTLKKILFIIFVIISLIFITKMLTFY